MKRKIGILLLFILAIIALYFGYKANRNFLKRYPRVQAAFVDRGELNEDIEVAGKVIADEARDLYINYDAKAQTIFVKEGDPVKTGQILMVFDSDNQKLQLAQCQADILRLEQNLAIKKTEGVTEIGLKIDQANLDVLYLRQKMLQKEIAELKVAAPINGRISQLIPKTGEKVNPGIKIAQIIDDSQISIEAEVPAEDGLKIKIEDAAEISFGTISQPFSAVVADILPPVKISDNTYSNQRIRLKLTTKRTVLVPGTDVRVRVRIGRANLALLVPIEAIHEELKTVRGEKEYFSIRPESGEKRKYVFVLRDCAETLTSSEEKERSWMIRDNIYQARKVYIETGVNGIDRVEVIKGLQPFEQTIIYSDRQVQDYDRVIVISRDENYLRPIKVNGGG